MYIPIPTFNGDTEEDLLFSERDSMAALKKRRTSDKSNNSHAGSSSESQRKEGNKRTYFDISDNKDDAAILSEMPLSNDSLENGAKEKNAIVKVRMGRIMSSFVKVMRVCLFGELHGTKISWRRSTLFAVGMYNMLFIPLNLSFPAYRYTAIFYVLEAFCLLFLAQNLAFKYKKYQKLKLVVKQLGYETPKHAQLRYYYYLQGAFLVLHFIPFSMIFEAADVPNRRDNFFLIALQLLRVTKYDDYFYPFFQLRLRVTALSSILEIIFSYFLLSHIFSCLLIIIGNTEEDFNNTWLAKVPAPQVYLKFFKILVD